MDDEIGSDRQRVSVIHTVLRVALNQLRSGKPKDWTGSAPRDLRYAVAYASSSRPTFPGGDLRELAEFMSLQDPGSPETCHALSLLQALVSEAEAAQTRTQLLRQSKPALRCARASRGRPPGPKAGSVPCVPVASHSLRWLAPGPSSPAGHVAW